MAAVGPGKLPSFQFPKFLAGIAPAAKSNLARR